MALLVANVPWFEDETEAKAAVAERLGVVPARLVAVRLLRRSVDARRRPPLWMANYRVEIDGDEEEILEARLHGVRSFTRRDEIRHRVVHIRLESREGWPAGVRPIVVGAGPALWIPTVGGTVTS